MFNIMVEVNSVVIKMVGARLECPDKDCVFVTRECEIETTALALLQMHRVDVHSHQAAGDDVT